MPESRLTWVARLRRSALTGALVAPLVLLSGAAIVAINEAGYQQATTRLGNLVLMGQARVQIARVLRNVSDAESAQRGYLITGRTDYLAPYRQATDDAFDGIAQLRTIYQRQQATAELQTLAQIEDNVRTKLGEMNEVLARYDAGRKEAALELMMTGIGRDQMVAIRDASNGLLLRQNQLIEGGLSQVYSQLTLNRAGVAVMTGLGLLALVLYLRQRQQRDRERAVRQAEILQERDRLELEVQRRTAELTDLARHLETTREDERARLARDLHDELGALLTAAKLDLARLRPKLTQMAPELLPRVAHLAESLNSGIALKRRIIEDLRPSSLDTLGLLPALEILCSEFSDRVGLKTNVTLTRLPLSPSCELTAFRLVQEALNNISKYAQAHVVSVSLEAEGEHAVLQVQDDGVGFDVAQVPLARHGLVGMRYRVQADGGRLDVLSSPGAGTRIQARLPLLAASPTAPSETQAAAPDA